MADTYYDIIIIGCGSAGLSVGLFINKAGLKVLMISKTKQDIGGECLNDGCIPSKALVHVAKIVRYAWSAGQFGLGISGQADIKKAIQYIHGRQQIIRLHENSRSLEDQGIEVAIGEAKFTRKNEIAVAGKLYRAKNIVIATGSKPRRLDVPGVEQVKYYDNENIFDIDFFPNRLLVIGGGPVGIEIAQAMGRLGCRVTVIQNTNKLLEHDEDSISAVLLEQLKKEGIKFLFNTEVCLFPSANEAIVMSQGDLINVNFDVVFVGIGRDPNYESLQLQQAGIAVKDNKIVVDDYLRTTNKNVFVCGGVAGSLQFSHVAEFHARILINNFFYPWKKKLNYDYISWVTFTDPEVATFGLNERQLKQRKIPYRKLEQDLSGDDRAVVDDYRYSKGILYISKKGLLKKEKILGGAMIAPNAGELVQELILANVSQLSINHIFNKIYPYPVASRINQQLITKHREAVLTDSVKKWLQRAYNLFGR